MGKREVLKWIFIGACAGLLMLAAFAGWTLWRDSPKRVVEKFMKAAQKEDWEAAWECLKLPDSPFLTAKALGGVLEDGPMAGLKSFQIKKTGEQEFTVSYEGAEGQKEEIAVQTEAAGRDGMWKAWKIVSPRFWAEDTEIEGYSFQTAQIDGILLTEEDEIRREENTVIYRIPYLFLGTHEVGATGEDPGFQQAGREVEIYQDRQLVIADSGQLTEESMEGLKESVREVWQQCLDSMVKGEMPEFVREESGNRSHFRFYTKNETLESDFNSLEIYYKYNRLYNDRYGLDTWWRLTELRVLELEIQVEQTGYQDGLFWVRLTTEGQIYSQWETPPGGFINRPGEYEKQESETTEQLWMIFVREDGKWKVTEFERAWTGSFAAAERRSGGI